MARQTGKPSSDLAEQEDRALEQGAMMGRPGRPLTRVQVGAITALQVAVPRDLAQVEKAVLYEATQVGAEFVYAWDVKNKDGTTGRIEGLSIDGAMVLLRNWKNATVAIEVVDESPTHWTFRAAFIDYEQGFELPRLFRQRKDERHGNFDRERALDIAFQIGQSKAERNAVAHGMPAWLVKRAIATAKKAAEDRFKDLALALQQAKAVFGKLGVTDAELVAKVGKPFEQWTASDHVYLSQVRQAILDRQTTVAQEFKSAPAEPAPGQQEPGTQVVEQRPAVVTPAPTGYQEGPQTAAEQLGKLAGDQPITEPEGAKAKPRAPAREPGED